jgi:O-antigen/teichoic acid export membrane protein
MAAPDGIVPSNLWISRRQRFIGWSMRIAEFGLVQGLVQVLTAIAGILLVRNLSKHDYALYAIANSMQLVCNLLADLGIGIGVASIGGRVWNDPFRFGQLLNTVLGLRRQFALISLSVCLPIAAWMLSRNGATIPLQIGLSFAIAVSLIPLLGITAWGTSAKLHGEYRRIQKLDLGGAALRLGLIGLLAVSRLNSLLAMLVGVVGNWVQALFLRRWAHEKIVTQAPQNAEDRRELLRLSKRWLPNVVFFCLQGQVTLFILTAMGSTTGIADITALGRVAALFTIFSVTFQNLLAPRFARCQDPRRLPRLYLLLVTGTTIIFLLLVGLTWVFPDPFLWLLGGQYATLRQECVWVVAAGCVNQIVGVMWLLNLSKAWIRAQSLAYIPMIVAAQVGAAFCLDLRQFHNVLIFNLITAAAPLPIFAVDAALGLRCRRST